MRGNKSNFSTHSALRSLSYISYSSHYMLIMSLLKHNQHLITFFVKAITDLDNGNSNKTKTSTSKVSLVSNV